MSNQQIVDCSRSQGNAGCSGGSIFSALDYVKSSGLTYRSNYPYHAYEGTCMNPPSYVRINDYTKISDCTALISALHNGPIAVMVDASNMQFYHGGIFSNCGTNLNYNMLLTASTYNSFRLKASWGPSWGEGGYIELVKGNTCGVCMNGASLNKGW